MPEDGKKAWVGCGSCGSMVYVAIGGRCPQCRKVVDRDAAKDVAILDGGD